MQLWTDRTHGTHVMLHGRSGSERRLEGSPSAKELTGSARTTPTHAYIMRGPSRLALNLLRYCSLLIRLQMGKMPLLLVENPLTTYAYAYIR